MEMELEQIKQMKLFIESEAKEKAHELEQKGDEEGATEKAKELSVEKPKLLQDMQRKKKQREVNKAIERSTLANKARLDKLSKRQEKLGQIQAQASTVLSKDASSESFIVDLIVEGLLMLLEEDVKVRCRSQDESVVKGAMPKAEKKYAEIIHQSSGVKRQVKLSLDGDNKLRDDKVGGVILSCNKGCITIDNTIAARLALVMEQAKPAIRKALFPNRK